MDTTPPPGDTPYLPRDDVGHIADYFSVFTRRLWLILGIFGITTAAAIWAVARQETVYQARLALQVNDPIERGRSLVDRPLVSGLDLFSDPIESEIQVLRSSQLARSVVHRLGLRLDLEGTDLPRSEVIDHAVVDSLAPDGVRYRLEYDGSGSATLFDEAGRELGSAAIGERLVAAGAGFSFPVQAVSDPVARFTLVVRDPIPVAAELTAGIAASRRENTSILDVSFIHDDRATTDDIVNALAEELRAIGARRVSAQAVRDIEFIREQLDSARTERSRIASRLQDFQQSRDFFSLSDRERRIVDQATRLDREIAETQQLQTVLASIQSRVTPETAATIDFAAIEASLPENSSPQVTQLLDELRAGRAEVQELVDQGLGAANPRLRSARQNLAGLASEFIEAVESRRSFLDGEIAALQGRRSELAAEQARFPDLQAQMAEFQLELQQSDQLIAYLRGQLAEQQIRQAAAAPYIDLIDPAVNATAIQPNGQLNVLLGALLGLVLGVGAAFFVEYLDRTVRTSADIEALLGIPVLGIIPRLRRIDDEIEDRVRGRKTPMIVAMDPLDPAAEAYRNLRMNLMFMNTPEAPIQTILFSSPGPDEGKSTTALNFAVMLAQQGERVLLIDADLRRPSLHRALDILREPGLTNLLVGDAETREAIRLNVLPDLDILPSGPFPPNPSELLNSRALDRLLGELRGRYVHVIIDCPPVLAVTDAAILAGRVDGTVLVLRSGETEQRAAERAVDQLRRLGARLFGAVLNEVIVAGGDEDYYLQYFYHYQPREEASGSRLRSQLAKAKFW
ncbi:MAG: polysaccharide biosynthesis tyrosine autokinase [Longimicrobiales bacterium]|nr:polysaccharide biosynthesis tyrosine autokinase [Longimicrobiales bacterium]